MHEFINTVTYRNRSALPSTAVIDVTLALPGWETWVISPDEAVLEVAARRGVTPIVEDRPPLAAGRPRLTLVSLLCILYMHSRGGGPVRTVISNSSGVPLYEQVKEQVKVAILSGELAEGAQLPSVRALARDLRISVITTTRAYADLAQEGFVANVQGRGAFVLPVDSDLVRERLLRDVEAGLAEALRAARLAGLGRADLVTMLDALVATEGNQS